MNTEKLKGKKIAGRNYYLDRDGKLTTDESIGVELCVAAGRPLKELPDGQAVPDEGEIYLESVIVPIKDRPAFVTVPKITG